VADIDLDARAARDFRAGEVIGPSRNSGWNRDLRASLIPAVPVADDNPLPFFMLEGNTLARDVPEGTVITRDMVILPQDSILWSLRKRQDHHYMYQ
jgi:predicted homoserine dehydrogenase-like protein